MNLRIYILSILLLLPLGAAAQEREIDAFIAKYSHHDDIMHKKLGGAALWTMKRLDSSMKGIDRMELLIFKEHEAPIYSSFKKSMLPFIESIGVEKVGTETEDDKVTDIYMKPVENPDFMFLWSTSKDGSAFIIMGGDFRRIIEKKKREAEQAKLKKEGK